MEENKIESNQKIELICQAAFDKKAEEIVVMEMRERTGLCDYFVVMSAPSSVRVKAIVGDIELSLKQKGHRPQHCDGVREGVWVLLDYGDVIAHVFYHEMRRFYNLETLWGDAPKRTFSP